MYNLGVFPGNSDGKESACNAGDLDLITGWGRSLGEGNGNPLQYSCLGNSMDRGAWQAIDHWVTQSQAQLKELKMQHEHQDLNSPRRGPYLSADLSETSLGLSYLCSGLA